MNKTRINKYKENIIIKQIQINNILHQIQQYNNELKLLNNDIDIDKINNIKLCIKNNKRLIGNNKSSIKSSTKQINKLIDNQINNIDHNVILLLINNIKDGQSILNLLLTNQAFNNLIANEYNYYILLFKHNNIDIYSSIKTSIIDIVKINKDIFKYNNISLEQLFYTPFTFDGATLLHLCAKHNFISLIKSIYKYYKNLNINCIQIYQSLHPVHYALLRGHKNMCKLLLQIGVDKNYIRKSKFDYNDSIEFLINNNFIYSNNELKQELYNSINIYNNKEHTIHNYKILYDNNYICEKLKLIDDILYQDKELKIIGK